MSNRTAIVRQALDSRGFPQLFDVVDVDTWLPTLQALRDVDGYVPSLSECEVKLIDEAIRAALSPELREGYLRLSDYWNEQASSEIDAAFAVGVEFGKRN